MPQLEWTVASFESLLPEIQSRAFALLVDHDPEAREEGQQEIVAQAWIGYVSASRSGNIARVTAFTLCHFAHRHYRSGRRMACSGRMDVMGERSRACGRVDLIGVDNVELAEMCSRAKDRVPAPWACTAWKLDMAAISKTLGSQQRLVLDLIADGWRNREIAVELEVTPSRISQITSQIGEVFIRFGYGLSG